MRNNKNKSKQIPITELDRIILTPDEYNIFNMVKELNNLSTSQLVERSVKFLIEYHR